MNSVNLTGRLTKDPILNHTQSGKAVVRFTVAADRRTQNDPNGADFISCVAWEKRAETIANHFKKGNLIGIEGSIKTGHFDKDNGERVYTTDVLVARFDFLESKEQARRTAQSSADASSNPQQGQSQHTSQTAADTFYNSDEPITISDDDLPF